MHTNSFPMTRMLRAVFLCAITAVTMLAFITSSTPAATRTFQNTGMWGDAANWLGSIKPGNGDDVIIAANCTVNEDIALLSFNSITINANIQFWLASYALVVTGPVTNNGFIHTECVSATPLPANKIWGGYVYFEAAAAQTLPPGSYQALKLSATGGNRTITAAGDVTVTQELSVEGFTGTNQAILDLGTWRLLGTPASTYVSGKLRTANASATPLPAGRRWYSNVLMRQGMVEFYASTPQSIPGGTYDADVQVSGGMKTLTGTMYSNGVLTLIQTIVVVGDSSLVLGGTGTLSSGMTIFSATNMIAINGSGSLIKTIPPTGTGSFVYPVGDITGTPEYSPAILQFLSAAGSITAAVRVVNAKHPQNTSPVSFLTRYWTVVVQSTGTGQGNATFTYAQADVSGREDSLVTGQWTGGTWQQRVRADTLLNKLSANSVQLAGDFTGGTFPAALPCSVDVKALLQGPASGATGQMSTALNAASLLPKSQPYSTAPWNYPGTESVAAVPSTVVDWVLLELRSTPSGPAVARRAAFIRADGRITDTDGTSPVTFPTLTSGAYYIIVRHRNHLAAMTANQVAVSASTPLFDFTLAQSQAYGTEPMAGLQTGAAPYALWAGDANADGFLKYQGTANDPAPILTRIGGSDITATRQGYFMEDVTMDGVVRYSGITNDRAVILRNIGGVNPASTRSGQVP